MSLNYRTFKDLSLCIRKNIFKLPSDIDLIVGIPRSGMIPAYMIALFLNKQVCSLDELIHRIEPSHGERNLKKVNIERINKILIVDDSIHSGVALEKTKQRLEEMDIADSTIKFLAIYAREESKTLVDYYFEVLPTPRMFQWNYLNANWLLKSCIDMDGVLCIDPTPEQNDDGERYIDFLKNAKPLYIPNYKINSIVTSRLEKYRSLTEEWLVKNNVKYENLFMLDLPSKAERIKRKAHASFKSEIYNNLKDTNLFIESNRRQAIEIAAATKKPCICVETDELFFGYEEEQLLLSKQMQEIEISGKNVLLYTHELTYTGAPHSLLRICKMFIKNSCKVEIWSRVDGDFRKEFENIGLKVCVVSETDLNKQKYIQAIKKFDLAIANTVISHKFYTVARHIIPSIWYIREAQNLPDICNKVPLRLATLKDSEMLYCVSEYAQDFIRNEYNHNVKVVHNCVEDFYDGNENIVEDKINIMAVGTINYRKAFDIYLDAFEALPKEYQKCFHLFFAGRTNDFNKNYWKPLIKRAKKNKNITFCGEITNTEVKHKLFKKMNVFVVVSRDEACSLVVLEAAMLGKPIIVSENVGAKYMVDTDNGWVIKTGSVKALREVFEQILRDPNKLIEMGRKSRQKYLKTSSMSIYEKNIINMAKEALLNSKQKKQFDESILQNRINLKQAYGEIESLHKKNYLLKKEIANIHNSWTYRIGRAVTFFPRKFRGCMRCYRENGVIYTLNRIKEKLKGRTHV